MIATKKRSLSLILAIMMLFALACSAWSVTGQQKQDGVGTLTVVDDIETNADSDAGFGAWALNGGVINIPGFDIMTTGNRAWGVYATTGSTVSMSGNIVTTNDNANGIHAYDFSSVDFAGDIKTSGQRAQGALATDDSSLVFNGTIATSGDNAIGLVSQGASTVTANVDISTSGLEAWGMRARTGSIITVHGNITTEQSTAVYCDNGSTVTLAGDVTVMSGDFSALNATQSGNIFYSGGTVTVHGPHAAAIRAVTGGTVTVNGGTIVTDDSSWSVSVSDNSTVYLTDVVAEGQNFVESGAPRGVGSTSSGDSSGVVHVSGGSITGEILHWGATDDTLEVNFSDTIWSGTTATSSDIGQIDISMNNSVWNVTGDSNTNGNITADSDSTIDYNDSPAGTVVEIDSLTGGVCSKAIA